MGNENKEIELDYQSIRLGLLDLCSCFTNPSCVYWQLKHPVSISMQISGWHSGWHSG